MRPDAPEIFGQLVDENVFGGVGGLMLGAERGAELVELGGIFAREYEGLGIETMLKGVAAGTSLGLGGLRAGRELRIGLVGGDLRRGCHTRPE
jgi:hypothetical protein